jgi:polyribonucleotide nucleotidyltransferase
VKIIAIDPVNGKVKLSRRQALTPEESAADVERLGLQAVPAGGDGDDRPPRRFDRGPRRDGGGFRGPRRDGGFHGGGHHGGGHGGPNGPG